MSILLLCWILLGDSLSMDAWTRVILELYCMCTHTKFWTNNWCGLFKVGALKDDGLSWRGCCFLAPSLVRASFLFRSWLLPNLTGLNWGWLEIQKRHRIDRQTENGVRCVGRLDGDTQPSLLLFSVFILRPYSLQLFKTLLLKSSLKPCLKPLSMGSHCPMFVLSLSLA
jgi:hypothetical protein